MLASAGAAPVGRKGARGLGRRLLPFAILVPGLGFYALFTLYPIVDQARISLVNFGIMPGSPDPFVGLTNYLQAFRDPVVLTAAGNTVLYVIVTVPSQLLIGLAVAHLMHGRLPGRGVWRTLIYIPVITSWVVVSFVFAYIFSAQGGAANAVLDDFLGPTFAVQWLQNTWTAWFVIWLLAVWKGVGWSMVIFLAALSGVPGEMVDAGHVDGAAGLRHWWYVVVPSIWSAVVFVLVMLVMGGVQAYLSIYLLTQGGPFNSTQVLLTYTYQQAFSFYNFSYSAALGTMIGVVLFAFSIFQLRVLGRRRWQGG